VDSYSRLPRAADLVVIHKFPSRIWIQHHDSFCSGLFWLLVRSNCLEGRRPTKLCGKSIEFLIDKVTIPFFIGPLVRINASFFLSLMLGFPCLIVCDSVMVFCVLVLSIPHFSVVAATESILVLS
jgi:hypothetical protein